MFSEQAAAGDPGPCTVAEFPSAVARLLFFPAPHMIVFRANDDPDTGERHIERHRQIPYSTEDPTSSAAPVLLLAAPHRLPGQRRPRHRSSTCHSLRNGQLHCTVLGQTLRKPVMHVSASPVLQIVCSSASHVYMLHVDHLTVMAVNDTSAGEPWCPDVRRTLPAVRRAVAEAGGTLLEVRS